MVSSIDMKLTIHFNVSHLFTQLNSSIWPMDWTLSGTITPDQSGPGSNDDEGVLHIPQSSMTSWRVL